MVWVVDRPAMSRIQHHTCRCNAGDSPSISDMYAHPAPAGEVWVRLLVAPAGADAA